MFVLPFLFVGNTGKSSSVGARPLTIELLVLQVLQSNTFDVL